MEGVNSQTWPNSVTNAGEILLATRGFAEPSQRFVNYGFGKGPLIRKERFSIRDMRANHSIEPFIWICIGRWAEFRGPQNSRLDEVKNTRASQRARVLSQKPQGSERDSIQAENICALIPQASFNSDSDDL